MRLDLPQLGATVISASRTLTKCKDTAAAIRAAHPSSAGKLIPQCLDTSDLDSVVEFYKWYSAQFKQVDLLVCNAGIVYLPVSMAGWPLQMTYRLMDFLRFLGDATGSGAAHEEQTGI